MLPVSHAIAAIYTVATGRCRQRAPIPTFKFQLDFECTLDCRCDTHLHANVAVFKMPPATRPLKGVECASHCLPLCFLLLTYRLDRFHQSGRRQSAKRQPPGPHQPATWTRWPARRSLARAWPQRRTILRRTRRRTALDATAWAFQAPAGRTANSPRASSPTIHAQIAPVKPRFLV